MVQGVASPGLYTAAEYAGGYDEVALTLPTGADQVEVNELYVDLLDPPPVFSPADPPRILCVLSSL